MPIFNSEMHKPQRRLYRTNPSIPVPESKYGSRSNIYQQILALKRDIIDPTELAVWQPEDVLLINDLLKLETKPLDEILKIERLNDINNKDDDTVKQKNKPYINTNITAMGRPINNNRNQTKWKPNIEWLPIHLETNPDSQIYENKHQNDEM
jgi:hypothetical protein